ncbi:MAG: DNA polymerase I [Clostridia bacterium]|nr:DNA polymerase I [Clostridia bacterium]
MKKMLCVDGNSIINRAFYGIRALTARDGTPTNAIYGLMNILHRHIEDISPDYFVVAFDVHAPTFRHKMYDEYKAGRHPTPPELLAQFAPAKDCIKALGAHCVEKEGYEADDILGTYARICKEQGVEAYIVTGDKDSLQLISDGVTVLLATTGESVKYDREAFFAKYGINPEQFVDMKALMGDNSDNIPGVAGIGEKTAGKLIADYGSLDGLYNSIEEKPIANGTKTKLIDGREAAYKSQELARIFTEVPDLPSLDDVKFSPDRDALKAHFARLGFSALIKRFGLDDDPVAESEIGSPAARSANEFADAVGDVFGCSIDFEQDKIYLSDGQSVFAFDEVKQNINKIISEKTICVPDSKSYYHSLHKIGIDNVSFENDLMLMGYVCSKGENDFSIEKLAFRNFAKEIKTKEEEAFYTAKLYVTFNEELIATGQYKLYKEIELPLAKVLFEMERDGFKVDTVKLREFSDVLGEAQDQLCERIYMQTGCEFNINSPKQLGHVLFEELKLPVQSKTKSGYSTSAEVLEALRPYSDVVDDILEYRTVGKLKSTYADGLADAADENGRVHTTFKQALTATGRLSSTEPNLQNIPIRTELGRQFRKFFIPSDENHILIDADYSQIELRLLCAISGDENMREAFLSGFDIHSATANRLFGSTDIESRKKAKAINFGIMYGMGEYSLSTDLHISRKQAGEYIKNYLETYPKIKDYLSNVVEEAKQNGYVKTLFGRRRYIPEILSKRHSEMAFGERVAKNSPIQGTAADIIKLAMVNTARRLKDESIDAKVILQVHDELIIESSKDDCQKAMDILKTEMENAVRLSVPLTVEIKSGENWYEAH